MPLDISQANAKETDAISVLAGLAFNVQPCFMFEHIQARYTNTPSTGPGFYESGIIASVMSFWSSKSHDALVEKLETYRIIVFLLSGIYCREIVRAMRFDWSILAGKRGCRWGGILLYFRCRYFAIIPLVCSAVVVCLPPDTINLNTEYVKEGTFVISNAAGFFILSVRVSSIWKHRCVGLAMSSMGWVSSGLVLYALSIIKGVFSAPAPLFTITAFFLLWSSILVVLNILGSVRALKRRMYPSKIQQIYKRRGSLYALHREKAIYCLIPWVAQVMVAGVGFACIDPQDILIQLVSLVSFVVIAICANRTFQQMVLEGTCCPMSFIPASLYQVVDFFSHCRHDQPLASKAASLHQDTNYPASFTTQSMGGPRMENDGIELTVFTNSPLRKPEPALSPSSQQSSGSLSTGNSSTKRHSRCSSYSR
ncbi:hypothetical protein ABKN59_006165 [Abortiporus biennis]